MKLVTAFIRPESLNAVKRNLFSKGFYSMSVTNILGSGRQKGFTETYRGVPVEMNLLKKVRIEIGINADCESEVVGAIQAGAKTGTEGDGVIFVQDVVKSYRIRTGEEGII